MKTITLLAALVSSSVMANECNINFQGGLELQQNELSLLTTDGQKVLINQNQELFVNNQQLDLSPAQQNLVNDYYQQINTIAPATAEIALDAIDVARQGVTLAFDELIGPDNQLSQELDSTLSDLQVQLNKKFYAKDGSIRFSSTNMKNGDFLGEDFESELEQKIESTVQKSIGTLMIAIGKQMLFSGGDMNEFEQKMENFGANIEQQIEASTSQLESRANALCYQMTELDQTECHLAQSVPQLASLNILDVEQNENKRKM